jgi:hypothetical protein
VVWGESPVPYDVSSILADYEQIPACQYTFNHQAKLLNPAFPQDPQQLLDLPPWFNFNPYTYVFGLDKCGSPNSMSDTDCNSSPFETSFTIVIVAGMDDYYGIVNKQASFDIRITVGCRDDYISFDTPSDLVTYYLSSSGEP